MTERTRVALVSTPWPLFNRPSVQMGALKAYASQQIPGLEVESHHFYLSVAYALGYDLYKSISERTWLSECCYAALLYPERSEAASGLWQRQSRRSPLCRKADFREICRTLGSVSSRLVRETDWSAYRLVGFSICFSQLTSALYFIRCIKERAPRLPVVVGGSACAGEMGSSLLHAFPIIDFAVCGEGEIPFVHLLRGLNSGGSPSVHPVPGLLVRGKHSIQGSGVPSQLHGLDQLPVPDYTDYFRHLGSLPQGERFLPELPMEISRGCWWRGIDAGHGKRGCAFCNLNLQWEGYRTKSPARILDEITTLSETHRVLSVSFTDNLIPPGRMKNTFEAVGRAGRDFRLFAEIRATTSRKDLVALKAAGTAEVQVGIEALSTSLLRKMNKGTTAIQNVEIMKHCEALGTPALSGNLILHFPGSDEEDVEETLRTLEFAFPLRPLTGVSFWLGRGSPVWQSPEHYGIRKVHNHPFYAHLFPGQILRNLNLLIQGYKGALGLQRALWRPVSEALRKWKAEYARLHNTLKSEPLLSCSDGGTVLIIRQRRSAFTMSHRIEGFAREIYLFCEETRSLSEILGRFPRFGEGKVLPFLNMMVDKRLMFSEEERYLSLAVPVRGYRG